MVFAFIWYANEDYDHKRKLVTILAYLLLYTCYYLFTHGKLRIIIGAGAHYFLDSTFSQMSFAVEKPKQ